MKLAYFATAAAAFALAGGAASAQQTEMPKAPTPGSVTGDWNGPHAPSDDKQYTEKVTVPVGAPAPASGTTDVTAAPAAEAEPAADLAAAPAATTTATDTSATFTNMTVTNGPVPDTRENRAKYGAPMSRAGKMTAPRGN
ncbi:MAG: hypothetical protein JNK30_20345 [Phenylobacterium sp.]|uniref:hypothetical protein n=1 Tax=Phenylobacterium sp. TaxID=1871053 RepID=UPI001A4776FD|nr:hypothetical protein [Phenylobacterium sp.]MBL8773747.1 hypothetical protein [Phenylobacterium sp.]